MNSIKFYDSICVQDKRKKKNENETYPLRIRLRFIKADQICIAANIELERVNAFLAKATILPFSYE